jgi:transcriptional regulator with XRE-family HTH domain
MNVLEGYLLCSLDVRLDKATFGPVLRTARERRGITLRQLAAETKLSVELWAALEENDLGKWPRQLFARSYVRDYALRVGLDADDVVNEFCRLFPEWGDRRAERTMRRHAAIVAHELDWEDLPVSAQRRATDRVPGAFGFFGRHQVRIIGAALDVKTILTLAAVGMLIGFPFWPSLAVGSLAYTVLGTSLGGRSLGLLASERLLKTLKSLPATRRLVSSRVEGA